MIRISSQGSFKKTTSFLEFMKSGKPYSNLNSYGSKGQSALARATPQETGMTANAWGYTVTHGGGKHVINWFNTNHEYGSPVAILIQYGHGTGTGGYVPGIDYINPAIRPVQDDAVNDVWKQVTNG